MAQPTDSPDRAGPREQQPLNLARIVHRLLTSRFGWAVDDLQEELGIADRTYRKYRKTLQDRFDPWFHGGGSLLVEDEDPRGRKYLRVAEPGDPSAVVHTAVRQLLALHAAAGFWEAFGERDFGPVLADLAQAVGRDGQRLFPMTFGRLLCDLDRLFVYRADAPKDYGGREPTLRQLLHGLVFHRLLDFTYDAANGELAEHRVEPLSLVLYRGGLYLLARYPGAPKVYTYAVDRVQRARAQDNPSFCYPARDEYDPAEHYRGTFGIFAPREERPTRVELVFDDVKWLKVYVREREWQPGQTVEDLDDGRLRLTFEVTTLVEVIPWVLQFGAEVEVLGPPELIEATAASRG